MLNALLQRFRPAARDEGKALYPTLANLCRQLHNCQRAGTAAGILESARLDLCIRLRAHFSLAVAQALVLKILNVCLARRHLEARSTSVSSRPIGIVVDPSNTCRLACPGCVHSARSQERRLFDWPNGTLSEDRLATLLRLYGPHAIGVYFCNYGEPLLNLNTPSLIRLAKTYLMGTSLSTSLSVQRFDADAYVRSGLDFMVLSIDGATQPVYQRFRRNGDLELVYGNVRKLVEAKRRLGKRTPVLSWNFLAFEHNAHEIPLAARKARELGVNLFSVVTPFDVTWDDPAIRSAAVTPGVRRLHWPSATNLAENWNPFPDSVDAGAIGSAFERGWDKQVAGDEQPNPGHTCHWLYKNIVMDAGGRIMPCCGSPRPDAELVFTTLDGDPGDPFNSARHRQARSIFSGARPASHSALYCENCEWDQTAVNIGGPEIRRYFRAADAAFFDYRSRLLLSEW